LEGALQIKYLQRASLQRRLEGELQNLQWRQEGYWQI